MKKVKIKVLLFLAVFLTSDLIFGMTGVTQCEIPMLTGLIILACILYKYGNKLFNKPMCNIVAIVLILNLIISVIFSFLNITYAGPLQIDYIHKLYEELFGKAIVNPEYKWADNILNGLIILDMIVQFIFKIVTCTALFQINKDTNGSRTVAFIKIFSLAYIPLYTLAKLYFLIEILLNNICEKSSWTSDFAQWWIYNRSDMMIFLFLSATVIFWMLVFASFKFGNLKKYFT